MANDIDELEINPFYKALQSRYVDLYEKAQKNCHLLCIPQTTSISTHIINTDFVDTHVLRPSPYFKDQYMTTHSSNCKTLTLSDNGLYFTTSQGFSDIRDVKILGEELAYNKEYKQYKIIILEEPFDSKFKIQTPQGKEDANTHMLTSKLTVKECTDFLQSFPDFKEILHTLNQKIQNFINHYMVLENYLDDAASRLQDICTQTTVEMTKHLKAPLNSNIKLRDVLAEAVESYVMNAVHDKVFAVISSHLSKQDQTLLTKYQHINKVRPDQIGVRREFSCPLPMAVVELANLSSLRTPREKLVCLKSTVDNITEGVALSLQELTQNSEPDASVAGNPEICITSDDLIPILVTVIAKAKCSHLNSDLFYVDHFMWASADRDRDDLGFCLVTFKAAVQYMVETDFTSMATCLDKELMTNLEDMLTATTLLESQVTQESAEKSNTKSMRDRRERQLNRITGFLEKTVQELKTNRNGNEKPKHLQSIFPDLVTPPSSATSASNQSSQRSSANLGDFLSALQDDEFDQPFGKQT
ncbi:ankyrin repeat domain-containing protein 27 [Biomphalaria glabrata]|nr:ankyrin repeat domain-containing protein 27-like [Biomphalaria glabrata]